MSSSRSPSRLMTLLAKLDNVVLSPHMICDTYELRRDVLALVARELAAFAGAGRPANILNPGPTC